ncbi:hypothetical protein ALC57_05844 [Trachymyrmex cornetzi]|uniref:Uncharacterized protein n=1 Tax=Trachymyrmex cornetzi TaxID=471704 RepID=A0A151J9Q4_9HYME|nr:hypothetical protein ALC57_05844 [Trachymyrmex cornetzi]
MVGSAPTMVVTGNATTSKEGSRRANYPLPARGVESVSHTVGSPLAVFNWRDVGRPTGGLSLARGGPTNIPSWCSLLSVESGRSPKAIRYRPSSNHKRCQLAIRRSFSDDSVGSFRETKAFVFRGKTDLAPSPVLARCWSYYRALASRGSSLLRGFRGGASRRDRPLQPPFNAQLRSGMD